LKLQRPAIVKKIKFGKYEKTHVCNLRKFKVLGGLEEDHMVLLFEGGLKNDSVPEVFDLRHKTNAGEFLPVKFVQIMPLLSWGPSFNFSIWYVELLGVDDPIFVLASLRNFNMQREIEIVRLCLKHCRQQGYDKTFAALKEETNVYLEDEIMTELYETLVNAGDFKKTEQLIGDYVEAGLLDEYIQRQEYKATWVKQNGGDSVLDRPGQRGGHQLIIDGDGETGTMYLYGGWDGSEDLSDLWSYDIKQSKWTLRHQKSELLDGPSPRACHKMVFDPCNSQIFILGRYLDAASRTKENLKSDFYLYDTRSKAWFLICDDVSQVGGPGLIYDHQMCLDNAKKTIYVFGGRVLMARDDDDMTNDFQYSGECN
jgi:muskelin